MLSSLHARLGSKFPLPRVSQEELEEENKIPTAYYW